MCLHDISNVVTHRIIPDMHFRCLLIILLSFGLRDIVQGLTLTQFVASSKLQLEIHSSTILKVKMCPVRNGKCHLITVSH